MFRGATNLNLDSKGRIAMPVRYRDQLLAECDGQLVVTADRDPCLLIYPLPVWSQIEQLLDRLPSLDPAARGLQRQMIGYATDASLDAQGRILISTPLREYAGLDKKLVLVGQMRKFELWDEEAWGASQARWRKQQAKAPLAVPEPMSTLSL